MRPTRRARPSARRAPRSPPTGLSANLAGTATIKLYTGQQDLYGDLVAGRLDAMFGDGLGSHVWLRSPELAPASRFVGKGYRLDDGNRHRGHAARTPPFSQRLNGALQAILANGTYERINGRYFPFSIY